MLALLALLPAVLCAAAQVSTPADAQAAFEAANITPSVIPVFDPVVALAVTYSFNGTTKEDNLGTNFTRPEVLNQPLFTVVGTANISVADTFVVTMIDPDAPTPQQPNVSQIRHFVGGGFKLAGDPAEAGTALFSTTPALSQYQQPTPPTTSDPHRYIFLLWRQPDDFPTTIDADISGFNVTAFAEQTGLGEPLAGNFITVSTNPDAVITDP